jgi:1-acyl-sn-glycerol-3-phosphate acyltransferase
MVRKGLRWVVRLLFKLFARVEVQGLEHIPAEGGFLLACNHFSRLDPALVFAVVDREDLTALVAEKYQRSLFFGWLVKAARGIYINREQADLSALRVAIDFLKRGGALGIAPEGTRSHTGKLMEGKTGVAYLADKAGLPVIPVAIWGTENAMQRLFHLRRPPIWMRVGQPFILDPVDRRQRAQVLQRNTEEIMCRIAALLPQQYRGVYAGHPRLAGLLAEEASESSSIAQR